MDDVTRELAAANRAQRWVILVLVVAFGITLGLYLNLRSDVKAERSAEKYVDCIIASDTPDDC